MNKKEIGDALAGLTSEVSLINDTYRAGRLSGESVQAFWHRIYLLTCRAGIRLDAIRGVIVRRERSAEK